MWSGKRKAQTEKRQLQQKLSLQIIDNKAQPVFSQKKS